MENKVFNKKILIVLNPKAGTMQANKNLTDIVAVFCKAGYHVSVRTTTKRNDASDYVSDNAKDFDIIVPIGGDGTFNEVVAGLIKANAKIPIGYIPAGSTNDYGRSLGLSSKIIRAAKDIINGEIKEVDIGEFNGRPFSYIASFGIFTQASCQTNQKMKNDFGSIAYLFNGIKEIKNIKSEHLVIHTEDKDFEGNYILGAIANTTSIAGLFKLDKKKVDLSDGKFEVILVKSPKDPAQFGKIILSTLPANISKYPDVVECFKASEINIETSEKMPWTLDGEYQKGRAKISIVNCHKAIKVIVPKKKNNQ